MLGGRSFDLKLLQTEGSVAFTRGGESGPLGGGWECHPSRESRLGQQPVRQRFAKRRQDYQSRQAELQSGWPTIVGRLSEARRFQDDFMAAVQNMAVR
jgi:hypothetical protein